MTNRTPPPDRNSKFVTIAGKRVPVRHATKAEATEATRNVLRKHAVAIANLKNR